MSSKPAELIRSLYGDWSQGDFASSADAFHPNVLFKAAIDERPVQGRAAMAESIRDIISTASEWTLHLEELIEEGEHVVVREHQHAVGRGSGLPLETTLYVAFKVRDGQVVEALWFENSNEALAAAGMPEAVGSL
ncbi:MAG: nuclear transport factor 2 family protein [Solirubrobacterales bacterium]